MHMLNCVVYLGNDIYKLLHTVVLNLHAFEVKTQSHMNLDYPVDLILTTYVYLHVVLKCLIQLDLIHDTWCELNFSLDTVIIITILGSIIIVIIVIIIILLLFYIIITTTKV